MPNTKPTVDERLFLLQGLFFLFPDDYNTSIYFDWERCINQAHQKEIAINEERYEKLQSKNSSESKDDPFSIIEEMASDDYAKTIDLTNCMHAALVVYMWSKFESYLKSIIRHLPKYAKLIQEAHKNGKSLRDIPELEEAQASFKSIAEEIQKAEKIQKEVRSCFITTSGLL